MSSTILKLKSEDGTVYDVEKYYLMSASGVFRDMLSMTENGSDPKPIDLPAHSMISGLFVNLVKHEALDMPVSFHALPETHPYFGDGSVKCFTALLDLLHQFDCAQGLHERTKNHFRPYYQFDPWPVFCAAAKHNDIGLAKPATASFGKISLENRWTIDPLTMDPEQASRIPLK